MKMGSFVKLLLLDPLKWPQMTQNALFFLTTPSAIRKFTFSNQAKKMGLKK